VHALNASVFESPAEANLVDTLQKQAHPVVSLVAENNDTVVGHTMLSPVSLSGHPGLNIMGLAPMAVAPAHQNKVIGSALVRTGLERCKELGYGAVVVLGHPGYYPRFGFFALSTLWYRLRIRRAGRSVHGCRVTTGLSSR